MDCFYSLVFSLAGFTNIEPTKKPQKKFNHLIPPIISKRRAILEICEPCLSFERATSLSAINDIMYNKECQELFSTIFCLSILAGYHAKTPKAIYAHHGHDSLMPDGVTWYI